ncbi:hypothetical protein [Hymenobacter crusticola]|uniref:Lipocalin-like domain-containing protein n=1 Tax=Hymenobacter crusticola TaxID=1770526 RepID=A0A243WH45_9BACT|nr:hypothetical protein [Hymenobacter crusticola]OUJ74858.1 hypothetical protein BXP70_08900 [Hymenobacter crusticola]
MNKFSIALCSLLTTTLLLSSCETNKDKEDVKPATKTELLIDKDWMLSALTTSPARTIQGKQITNLFPYVDECTLDDVLHFAKPNVYQFGEGTTKCNANDEQTLTGTWALRSDETVLATQFPGYKENTYNVLDLDNNLLKLKTNRVINGVTYTETYTYTKQ